MSDTIYREDAIKAIGDRRCWLTLTSQHGDMGHVLWDEYYIKFEDAIEALLLISSADRPQGEWIDMGGYEVCKNCHEVKRFPHWNFCPNCGARMKGTDDETN